MREQAPPRENSGVLAKPGYDYKLIREPHAVLRYGLAVLAVAVATIIPHWTGVRFAVTPSFICAVLLSGLFGGMGPGLLATALADFAVDYFFVPPVGSLAIETSYLPGFVLFSLAGLLVAWLSARQRNSAKFLNKTRDDLDLKVRELEQANATLNSEIRERKRSVRSLAAQHAVTRILAESDNLDGAGPQLLRAIGENMEWDWGALWVAGTAGGSLGCRTLWRASDMETAEFDRISQDLPFVPGQGVLGKVWQDAVPRWLRDVTTESGFRRRSAAVGAQLHGAVMLPILLGGQAFGVIEFFSREVRDLDEEQLAVLLAIGSQIGQFITRKRAEEEIQRSEKRYRALIERGYDIILLVDAQDRVLYASPALTRVLGYRPEEVIGRKAIELVHPDERNEVLDRLARVLESPDRIVVGEAIRRRHKDGSWRWFEGVSANLLHEPGVQAVVVNLRDVTERKQAEEALRKSEEEWRELFEHNPAMYFLIDPAGTVLSVNSFGAAQLGYVVHELVGQPVLEVFLAADREFVRGNVARCLEKPGQPMSWEVRKIRKDGSILWVRENAKAVRRGENHLILIACEDITERKRSEDALRQSEMYLAEAQKISQTGSFGLRLGTGDLFWSEETFRIFGYDPATKPTVELVLQRTHPEDRNLVRRFLHQGAGAANYWNFEPRLLMPDASLKYIRVAAHGVTHASGERELVGAVMDITAAKGAEQELQRARMELAHVTRVMTLGELSAAIAHEINQPLAAVVTDASAGLRWLGGEVPNLAEARQVLARIQKNGNRAADVIGRIRALAKKSPVRMDQLDINDVILDVIVLMRSEIDRNHIALRTALAKDLPRIPGDRVQLQQVMLNLIMNGIEAMSAGEPRSLVIASQSQGSRNVLVSVCDSGPGLDAASIDHIFDPFHTTKPGGMGMGLAISRSIIETHGGRLSARPNAPRGAMFEIELPGEQKHASAIRDPAQAAPAGVRDVTP